MIDDLLPTRNGKLMYLRSGEIMYLIYALYYTISICPECPNEFWPALVEKAFAKFYGSYANIESGNSIDAGVDFTGGLVLCRMAVYSSFRWNPRAV